MKQQLLQKAIDTAHPEVKAGKFNIEFAIMMMNCGRFEEADKSIKQGMDALVIAIEILGEYAKEEAT